MRWLAILLAASLPLTAVACGATITQTSAAGTTAVVTSASATFMTRDDGKDEDSAATVHLLDVSGRLMAEGTVVDVEFDDQTVSEPLRLAATRAATIADLDRARTAEAHSGRPRHLGLRSTAGADALGRDCATVFLERAAAR